LREEGFLPKLDGHSRNGEKLRTIVATYDYVDDHGKLIFQVCRFDPKDFRQRRPDGAGGWVWKLGSIRRVLYNLPRVIEAVAWGQSIFICEGEKDCETLRRLGILATTNPGGVKKWRKGYSETLRGAVAILLPDCDEAGYAHMNEVAATLSGIARSVRVIDLAKNWPDGEPPQKADITDWIAAGGSPPELWDIVEKTSEWTPSTPAEEILADDGRPQILVADGRVLEIITAAEEAMLAAPNQPVYQRSGALVRLLRLPKAKTTQGVRRPAGALVIERVTSEWLRCRMAETATYVKRDGRRKNLVPTDPLIRHAAALASRSGEWRFPNLHATVEAPTLRLDGSILQTPGYDSQTGLYFEAADTFPPIPENPSRAEAQIALREVGVMLADFPFVDGAATSVAFAAILTGLVRRSLPTAPMFVFDAPSRGSGKTLLARVVSIVSTGREPTTSSFTGDADEERKRIVSLLAVGDPVICVDNISRPLEGDALCSVLTSPEFHDRRLGTNEMLRVTTCATWLGTGNNVVVRGDMATRVLIGRIDPGVENPEEREFDVNLIEFLATYRPRVVACALTMLRAYVAAGRPRQPIKPFGRFEVWSDLVRATLVWLGCEDPCAVCEQLKRSDPETEALAAVLAALDKQFPNGQEFSTAQIIEAVRRSAQAAAYGSPASPLQTALEDALPRGDVRSRSLGMWFHWKKDRLVNGLRLQKIGT
jgi:hypothetical protein